MDFKEHTTVIMESSGCVCLKANASLFIFTSGMQRVVGVMEINSECREVFSYHTADHNEFIYLILGLFVLYSPSLVALKSGQVWRLG